LPRPDASLASCDVIVPSQAEQGMKARFDRLTQAMAVLGRDAPRTLQGLPPNGDFEEPADYGGMPAGWNSDGEGASCVLDPQTVHAGKGSLRLSGDAGSAAVSEPFQAPSGRTVALNVWLRARQP